MKVYMCGPITGLTLAEAIELRRPAFDKLAALGISVVSPLRGMTTLDTYSDHELVVRDRNDVLTCDVMLADFRGSKWVSVGSVVEFGWADAARKPIVTLMKTGNVHDHAFIRQLSATVTDDLDEAVHAITLILNY